MCAGTCDSESAVLVAVDENVTQAIVQAELQETVTGACNGETVLGVMIHNQAMGFCAVTETAVMVCSASGAVLDAQDIIVVVHHLVKQRGADFLDGTGQGTGSNVDLVGSPLLTDPGVIPKGEVAIGFGCGLNGDGGPCKYRFKKFLIHQVENPVEISGDPVVGGKLFHKILLDFGGAEAYNKHAPD